MVAEGVPISGIERQTPPLAGIATNAPRRAEMALPPRLGKRTFQQPCFV
jgi:hypothetical protein